MIVLIDKSQLPECLDVIQKSFATVAENFGFTEQNCPGHTSFMKIEKLQYRYDLGFKMYGLYDHDQLIGFFSLVQKEDKIYELNTLSVLPEYRHNGYGKYLIDCAKEKVLDWGGNKITIGITEESTILKEWYEQNGFVHVGTQKFEHLPFIVGYMEWNCYI